MNAAKKEMGERLRQIRGDLSQQEFADSLSVSRAYISDVERGKTKPSLELLAEVAVKYHSDIHWLVTGEHQDRLVQFETLQSTSRSNDPFKQFLDTLWDVYEDADDDTQAWMRIQLKRSFPDITLDIDTKKQQSAASESA